MQYRLNTPAMGILNINGCGLAVTIPAGTVLTVDNASPDSSNYVNVHWSGKSGRMFEIDLKERAERLPVCVAQTA